MTVCDSGVYLIRNSESGDSYVGTSARLKKRLENHQMTIRAASSPAPSDAYEKAFYGVPLDKIEFRILEFIPTDASKSAHISNHPALLDRELFWIRNLKPTVNIRSTKLPVDVSSLPTGVVDLPPVENDLRALASA